MHTDKGRNITMPPDTHTMSELGPFEAAVAVHCRLQPAVTMNSATSRTPSARIRRGASGAEFMTRAPLSRCRSRPRPRLWEYKQHPERLVFQVIGENDYYGFGDDTTVPDRAEAELAVSTIAALY